MRRNILTNSLRNKPYKERSPAKPGTAPVIAASLAAFIMFMARFKGPEGILLFDRLIPGLGWLQITLISVYAAIIAHLLLTRPSEAKIRLRIWTLFSLVFFAQFLAGILISDKFLMSGNLHLPIPAVIIGGPLYRGSGLFMPILFLSTVILTGPAWCSYLCYFGSWDGLGATVKKTPLFPPNKWKLFRYLMLLVTIAAALSLRFLRLPGSIALFMAIGFGIAGILIMIFISRRKGFMAHCVYYCPISILSNFLGKISPFRLVIDPSCTSCMKCTSVCRYNALSVDNLKSGKAGFNCTLCGDCISTCSINSINYKFLNLSTDKSRILFTIIIAAVHASFLGIARI